MCEIDRAGSDILSLRARCRRTADHRHPGVAGRNDHPRRPLPAGAPATVPGTDRAERAAVQAGVARPNRATQGRAQHPVDHDRRCRFRRTVDLRRRDTDSDARPARRQRAAVHELPHDVAMLADPRGAAHGTQPPFGRFRRHLGTRNRVSGLQQRHGAGERDRRTHPEGQRLPDIVVRQEPQHAGVRDQPRRAVRPVADRHGFRLLLRVQRRRRQPVGADAHAQYDADHAVRRPARLEPHYGHGRRGHRLDARARRHRPVAAVLHLLRAGRDAFAAPPDTGVDQQDQRHAPLRQGLRGGPRADLRQPEAARCDSTGRPADTVAQGHAEDLGPAHPGGTQAAREGSRRLRGLPRLCRPRDRPRDPGDRRHGQARQHPRHLHQRRQRRLGRGLGDGHVERGPTIQRRQPVGRREHDVLRQVGRCRHLSALLVRMGLDVQHAVQVDQADRVVLRRDEERHGDFLAGADQGQRRSPLAVPPRHRHRAHAARGVRHRATGAGGRHRTEADRGGEPRVHLRQGRGRIRRAVAAPDAVLRDARRLWPVQRRVDAQRQAAARSVAACRRGDPRSGHGL